jgi:glycosyltransferase involved in cell wall biosynthesis
MSARRSIRRVAIVLQSVAVGGMETHAVDLAGEYVRRKLAVMAVVPAGAPFDGLADRFATAGATVERLNTDSRSGRAGQVRGLARLARALRRFRPDVVHVHTGGATGGLAPVAIGRVVTRATVGITEHDVPGESPRRGQRVARQALDRLAHLVVAVSRRNARLRQERLPVRCGSFAVVLNGVPIPESPDDAVTVAAPGEGPVIGSLVRLAEGKGLETLIRAFAAVRAERNCRLLLVGDGPLREGLEALADELGVGEDVMFAGHQANPVPYLQAMDVFCLAVPAGSMSIALLEAMALGLPPVITFGGPEEAVIDGETGLLAAPENPADLARALRTLVDDGELRRRLGDAAARHVRVNYSVSRVADDLLEAFKTARVGRLTPRLRADGPPDPRPGEHDGRALDARRAAEAV